MPRASAPAPSRCASPGPGGFDLERSYTLAAKPATQVLTRRTVREIAKRREPHPVERPVGRPRARLRRGRAVGRPVDRARCRGAAQGARPLSVRLLRADHQPRAAAALRQRAGGGGASRARHGGRPAHPRRHRPGAGAPGVGRLVRPVVGRRRRRLARRLRHRLPDAGARARLRGAGHRVPARARPAAQPGQHRARADSKDGGRELAYALYVLARNGVAPIGDLRYLADTKLNDVATPIAKAQIAAALGMLGDRARAERVYAAALEAIPAQPGAARSAATTTARPLRDAAALVTLAAEGGGAAPDHPQRGRSGSRRRAALTPYTSTQENAWLVLAARALAKDGVRVSLDVAGEARQGPLYRNFAAGRSGRRPDQGHQHRRCAAAGGGLGHRRAASRRSRPPSAASRSSAPTTRSTASGPTSPR